MILYHLSNFQDIHVHETEVNPPKMKLFDFINEIVFDLLSQCSWNFFPANPFLSEQYINFVSCFVMFSFYLIHLIKIFWWFSSFKIVDSSNK